jgi:uncharacterized protein (DUF1800 family)
MQALFTGAPRAVRGACRRPAVRALARALAAASLAALAACSGSGGDGGGSSAGPAAAGPAASVPTGWGTPVATEKQPPVADAARFLAQASFGPVSEDELATVRRIGYEQWLERQFALPFASHLAYVRSGGQLNDEGKPREEAPYEAIWQHWLYGEDQLRARVAFALSQVFVISNVAPDLHPLAMASYMDVLNRNAFGNWRQLLEEVTLHPAMGYYLNLLGSRREDPEAGSVPNENYAREVLQLFSIGKVRLNPDGTPQRGPGGVELPTYDQDVVLGFAKALSGWSFGGRDTADEGRFDSHGEGDDWTRPMAPWPAMHSPGPKTLLDGRVLPGGQPARKDLADALDAIYVHPNVGPFLARRLIQRMVTGNPSPAYVGRVAAVFADDGRGIRGNLRAVVRAVLLDPEARDLQVAAGPAAGKQREPVVRFANVLRALGARSASGSNAIRWLDSGDDALGQSPLLSPTVFNFFSPDYRLPGTPGDAPVYAPEFQITNETTVVGTLNFFARLVREGGYGWDERRLSLDYAPLEAMSADPAQLAAWIDRMLAHGMMDPATRATIVRAVSAIPARERRERVEAALLLATISPDFVIQR